MLTKSLWFLPPTLFGTLILCTSIIRTSSIKYQFEPSPLPVVTNKQTPPSLVLPGSPLWPAVVASERVTMALTFDPLSKGQKLLNVADNRLMSALVMFERGESGEAYSVLTKAEKYLEQAAVQEHQLRRAGQDTSELLQELSIASKKHIDMIETIQEYCPETARPLVVLTANYPKRLQAEVESVLVSKASNLSTFQ
jgi:hypothetical protein